MSAVFADAANFIAPAQPSRQLIASSPDIEVLPPTVEQFRAGATLHASRADKRWSLTDCITFSVMTDRRFVDALTTDYHFEQAGFRALMRAGG